MTKSLFLIAIWIIVIPLYAASLNDTGITLCGNYSSNIETCPQADYPGQDAEYGRDTENNDPSDGHAGFSFTKLDINGNDLPASAENWSCVRDNITSLIWEVKTDDGGLHDMDWTYTWYGTNVLTNGGSRGTANLGLCDNEIDCDTSKYVGRVNNNTLALCGLRDWRMPTRNELISLSSFDRQNPAIDTSFFINSIPMNSSSYYWSASPLASDSNKAWALWVYGGGAYFYDKHESFHIRLVREDK